MDFGKGVERGQCPIVPNQTRVKPPAGRYTSRMRVVIVPIAERSAAAGRERGAWVRGFDS
jgi:hypothetical protein